MLKPLFSRSGIAYMSVFVIIAFLIIMTNILTQMTFAEEIATRSLASTMSLQELRTQAIFRNSLLSILPHQQLNQYNALKIDPTKALAKNLVDVESTNKALTDPRVPAAISKRMKSLQPDFRAMDTAGHAVLIEVKAGNIKVAAKQVGTLWAPEQKYLQGTYAAYQDLTQSADDQINYIVHLEQVILVFSLITLSVEARFVAWPLIRGHYTLNSDLINLRTLYQQREENYAKEDHSTTSTQATEESHSDGEEADH